MSLYEILELDTDCSDDDIRISYKKLILKYHPDKGGNSEYFTHIKDAYEILSDPLQKVQYDLDNKIFYKKCKDISIILYVDKNEGGHPCPPQPPPASLTLFGICLASLNCRPHFVRYIPRSLCSVYSSLRSLCSASFSLY